MRNSATCVPNSPSPRLSDSSQEDSAPACKSLSVSDWTAIPHRRRGNRNGRVDGSGYRERLFGQSSGYRERLRPFLDSWSLPWCAWKEAEWRACT